MIAVEIGIRVDKVDIAEVQKICPRKTMLGLPVSRRFLSLILTVDTNFCEAGQGKSAHDGFEVVVDCELFRGGWASGTCGRWEAGLL